MEYLWFLGLALVLGFKHAYDVDHIVAVGAVLTRTQGLKRSVTASFAWAAGHMATAGVLTLAFWMFRDTVLQNVLGRLELAVAAMLVLVGAVVLVLEFARFHDHPHSHGGIAHDHRHMHLGVRHVHKSMLGIGIVHGIASNDELLLLLTASLSVTSLAGLLAGIGVFSLGVVAGMVLFAVAMGLPLVRARGPAVRRVATGVAGVASIAWGSVMFGELLFPG